MEKKNINWVKKYYYYRAFAGKFCLRQERQTYCSFFAPISCYSTNEVVNKKQQRYFNDASRLSVYMILYHNDCAFQVKN